MGDPYVDPRTGVLRNRLGITDSDELRLAETDISTAALFALEVSPYLGEGHFDFGHLRALHVQIFGEVYTWAGKPRSVEIGKGQWFCRVRQIPAFAASIFTDLARENYLVGLDRHDLVRRIAATYGQLNALHPFREGNGRTQRAFLTQLGRLGGWRLRWADLDRETNDEASRRSLERGDDSVLMLMVDELLEEEPPRPVPTGPRRVVLAAPAVAREIPGGVKSLRVGPYPARARCSNCGEKYALADEPTVLLLRPLPPPHSGILTFAHAQCSRSRVLPQPSAREVRAWQASLEREGVDATGVAILIEAPAVRAAFAWRSDQPVLGGGGEDDVVDLLLNKLFDLGLQPTSALDPPRERTAGWSLKVGMASHSITVVGPDAVPAFIGDGMDLPAGWLDAIATSGDCVVYVVSRGELDPVGLDIAAQQGRVLVGLATASVEA